MPTIARAALTVIERDGLPGLSMRAVANELGVGTMSLYRYVESREQLEQEVVGLVFGEIDARVSARSSWTKRVALLLDRARIAMGNHPALIPLLVTRSVATVGLMRWSEAVMSALVDGGFEGKDRAIAFRTLLSFVIGAVQYESFGPIAQRSDQLTDVPSDEYPILAETLASAAATSADEVFRRGLASVLRGLESDE